MTLPADGRRDNGLPSAEWGALVDLDPRLSDALLDSLAAEGVPAFVEPARDTNSSTRATSFPSRPLDRLWVDPSRADLARGVVTSEVSDLAAMLEPGANPQGLVRPVPHSAAVRVLPPPELPGVATSPAQPPIAGDAMPSDDELFRQIVAGFSTDTDDPVPRWPVSEDVTPDEPRASGPLRRRRSDRARDEDDDEDDDGLPGWVEPAPIEDEGHYSPPSPPKVGLPRPRVLGGVALVLLGFVALFQPTLIGFGETGLALLLGLVLTTGGASVLVMSMKDQPPTDTGPDDGAVV